MFVLECHDFRFVFLGGWRGVHIVEDSAPEVQGLCLQFTPLL